MMMPLQLFLTNLVLATSSRILKVQKRKGIEPERIEVEGVEHQTEEEVEEVEEEIYTLGLISSQSNIYQIHLNLWWALGDLPLLEQLLALECLQETTGQQQHILQSLNRIIQTFLVMRLPQQIIEIFLEPCQFLIFQMLVIKDRRKWNFVITVKW